jgi:hypothetical protein
MIDDFLFPLTVGLHHPIYADDVNDGTLDLWLTACQDGTEDAPDTDAYYSEQD